MINIAVIIPYYQKKAGILQRAINSVLQQNLPDDIHVDVIVVDDGSPLPARTELGELNFNPPFHLILVEQPNGGVAVARSSALRKVNEATTYVSFLDSDDIWNPEHLARAISALNLGNDYYFCNNRKIDHHDSYFLQTHFEAFLTTKATYLTDQDIYEFSANDFLDFSLRDWVSLTSTIVYRRSLAPDLLFNASLNVAGEDCLFFMTLMTKSRRICCSKQVLVTHAEGVNIYYSKFGWDDPGHLVRHMGVILALYEFQKHLPLSNENKKYIVGRIKIYRKHFAFLTIRYFLKKRELWSEELVKMTQHDPHFWLWYPLHALYVGVAFPLRLYVPLNE